MVREYQRLWTWCLYCTWEDNLDGAGPEHTKKMMKMVCATVEKGKLKSRADRGLVWSQGQAEKMLSQLCGNKQAYSENCCLTVQTVKNLPV